MSLTPHNCEVYDQPWQRRFRRLLFAWYARSARDLPWRRTRDPYAIWISEIMLQQTQVATVIPYFQRFLAAFPNISSLAQADEQDVLRLWEGLGYYRRARQLHRAAGILATRHAGVFPRDPDAVRSLPGVGRYTAGAILSIAFDQRQPILEANTMRLFSRLIVLREDPRSAEGQRALWSFAAAILPTRRAGAFNQALMELGSEICRPRGPLCEDCPVQAICPTRQHGLQDLVPRSTAKPDYQRVRETAVVLWKKNRILVRQCQPRERWAGLWDLPRIEHFNGSDPTMLTDRLALLTGVRATLGKSLTRFRYGVTRFRIELTCFHAHYVSGQPRAPMRWVTLSELQQLPLSVTGRKIGQMLIPQPRTTKPANRAE